MQHHIQIDQSVKIEQTQANTVLALSDGIERTLLISAQVKRTCQQTLRARGIKPGMIALRMFAAGLVLLLEDQIEHVGSVTIDTEYTGKEGEIKGLLLRFVLRWVPDFPKGAINFRQIGKRSRAHTLAWETHQGWREPDRRVTLKELLKYC